MSYYYDLMSINDLLNKERVTMHKKNKIDLNLPAYPWVLKLLHSICYFFSSDNDVILMG